MQNKRRQRNEKQTKERNVSKQQASLELSERLPCNVTSSDFVRNRRGHELYSNLSFSVYLQPQVPCIMHLPDSHPGSSGLAALWSCRQRCRRRPRFTFPVSDVVSLFFYVHSNRCLVTGDRIIPSYCHFAFSFLLYVGRERLRNVFGLVCFLPKQI